MSLRNSEVVGVKRQHKSQERTATVSGRSRGWWRAPFGGVALMVAVAATAGPAQAACVDGDGDGWDSCWDCDDTNPLRYPGAQETTCDGIDNDCDGKVDENYKAPWTECGVGACLAWGKLRCIEGQLVDDCAPSPPTGDDSDCDIIDDDCDGQADEHYVPVQVTCGTGPCTATGLQTCVAGKFKSSCVPGLPIGEDKNCDNVDDDCDGITDDGYNGAWVSCGSGECLNWAKTACVAGVPTVSCTPLAGAAADTTCDNKDDDCDGLFDEDYPTTVITCGKGSCTNTGTKTCKSGKIISSCTPLPAPGTDDNCDGFDNDCDGLIDEAYKAPWTECGFGGCANYGKLVCQDAQLVDTCVPFQPSATDDATCDNKDDDCDGQIDEDVAPIPITCGIGGCLNTGEQKCIKGEMKKECTALPPPEDDDDCDGVDDDCDGQIDEHFFGEYSTCGTGACTDKKRDICVNAEIVKTCKIIEPTVDVDTTCNNWDDDCDGQTDEDYTGPPVTCGEGACQVTGKTVCVNGEKEQQCTPGSPDAADDDCDGVDDNCDGVADNQFVGKEITCGLGVCLASGVEECVDGAIVQDCTPKVGSSTDATCDGLDDDCDGAADDDYQPTTIECGHGQCTTSGLASCVGGAIEETCGPMEDEGVEECDGFDNDCDGEIDEDVAGVYYTATQNGVAVPVRTFKGLTDVATFYKYETAYDFSAFNGFERIDRTTLVLHRGPSGALSLVVIHDSPLGDTGGTVLLKVEGLAQGSVVVEDDPSGGVDTYNMGSGMFYWNWSKGTTDGVAIENVGTDVCVTLTGVIANGTSGFDVAWGAADHQRVALGPINKSVKLCGSVCCEAAATDECDGVDNDCDGSIDEDAGTTAITCGSGGCEATGQRACADGVWVDQCTPKAPASTDGCDGIDNDCDGEIDEDFAPQSTSCGSGPCAGTGQTSCQSGKVVDSCASASSNLQKDYTCNGIDDDCDGKTDEDFPGSLFSCGVGACEAPGKTVCENGTVSETCTPGTPAADDSACNGIDDDCDGEVDEDFAPATVECGVGACTSTGVSACVNGVESNDCVPYPMPEGLLDDCNGIDDDCDGSVDEDHPAVPTTCGTGACAATGEIACEDGLVVDTCEEGKAAANDSKCDGKDNDCDGEIDEEFTPATSSCGKGVCASAGVTSCVDGVLLDSCEAGAPLSTADDTCDGIDEDCDGKADEDFSGEATTCGVGACGSIGEIACKAGQLVDTCKPSKAAADDSECNGADDDCDGIVDEDAFPTTISCGFGPCVAAGISTCVDGALVEDCTPLDVAAADDATCDAIDDDCDGDVDEDFPVEPTACQKDTCTAKGELQCQDGEVVDTCVPPVQQPDDSACDGIDNDCDGETDEEYAPVAVTCGLGPCIADGVTACIDGAVVDVCVPGTPAAETDEVCDGEDEDCDGTTDEDFVVEVTACGQGVCAAEGEKKCESGVIVDTCTAGSPLDIEDPTCDGVDEDCDGAVDDDFFSEPIVCGVGACVATGTFECVDGQVVEACEPAPPSEELCDRIDNDCDGFVDDGFGAGGDFTASQGLETIYVPVVEGTEPVANFYAYDSGAASSMSGLGVSNRSTFMLYRDPSGLLSLIIVNDAANDGSGGHLVLDVEGFTSGIIAAGDDPASDEDKYDVEAGHFEWKWRECCTDGVAIQNVGDDLCISVVPTSFEGLEGFDIAWGATPEERVSLSGGMQPFAICASMCDEPPPPLDCFELGLDPSVTPPTICQPANCPAEWSTTDATCDGVDDDCDGAIDEDFTPATIICGMGECIAFGTSTCVDGVPVDQCEDAGPVAEICDGLDNDCNGESDDGLAAEPIECGQGPCVNAGERICSGGQWVDACEPLPAAAEVDDVCDGVDADCDGAVDDDYAPETQVCGVGACLAAAETTCEEGVVVGHCEPLPPSTEVCDALDNDCDGQVDEDVSGALTTCGVGACAATGSQVCEFGVLVDTCKAGHPATSDDTCNLVDDDCDGSIDEDWTPPASVCGGDPTKATCQAGVVVADCEVCDGADNDGDGTIDEDSNGVYYQVSQGDQFFGILPVKKGMSVTKFYDYHGANPWSSDTGFEKSEKSTFFVYEDAQGIVSLVMIHDGIEDGTGGELRLRLSGLDQGEVVVKDDAPGGADSYTLQAGRLMWKWNGCCTDGAAIENVGDNFCVTVTVDKAKGINGIDFVSGDNGLDRISLPSLSKPFTICRTECCAPDPGGEVCDGKDNDCDGEADEGLLTSALFVTQNGVTHEVQPMMGTTDVMSFYKYDNPDEASANTGLELPNTTVLVPYVDPAGAMSLVMLHDAPRDGSGGKMLIHIDGLTGAEQVFMDDPKSNEDKYNLKNGYFSWVWYSCCTDGAVISALPKEFCLTLKPSVMKGIDNFVVASGNGKLIKLPTTGPSKPLTICSIPYCMDTGLPVPTPTTK